MQIIFNWWDTEGTWVIVKKSSPKNLSADCRSTVGRQVTDSLPTANQQVTDRLRKKKNCVKNEQLTWHNNPTSPTYRLTAKLKVCKETFLPKCCYQMRIGYITCVIYNTPDNLRIALEDNLIEKLGQKLW